MHVRMTHIQLTRTHIYTRTTLAHSIRFLEEANGTLHRTRSTCSRSLSLPPPSTSYTVSHVSRRRLLTTSTPPPPRMQTTDLHPRLHQPHHQLILPRPSPHIQTEYENIQPHHQLILPGELHLFMTKFAPPARSALSTCIARVSDPIVGQSGGWAVGRVEA